MNTSAPIKKHGYAKKLLLLAVVLLAAAFMWSNFGYHLNGSKVSYQTLTRKSSQTASAISQPAPNYCANNELSQNIVVSISARHLWACSGTVAVFNSPVVTGMQTLAADLTPVGVYHIYAKARGQYLKGSDSTGSWDDYVNYWMPFLFNQYGAYGFHDATWRPANAFGNINPDSLNGSHGCVECPLATAAWLYNWAPVGTTVTIES